MKQLDHYCQRFRCKMRKEACIGRQLLAIRRRSYRINAEMVLVCQGFYPECWACARGRSVALCCGINVAALRKQIVKLREQIEESPWIEYRPRRIQKRVDCLNSARHRDRKKSH